MFPTISNFRNLCIYKHSIIQGNYKLFSTKSTIQEQSTQMNTQLSLYPNNQVLSSKIREVRLIKLRYVRNMTRNGKIPSYSAAVVVGNGEGGLGYGICKDKRPNDAILKATKEAEKKMEYFELYEGRTFFHDVQAKFKATKVFIRPMPPGNTV